MSALPAGLHPHPPPHFHRKTASQPGATTYVLLFLFFFRHDFVANLKGWKICKDCLSPSAWPRKFVSVALSVSISPFARASQGIKDGSPMQKASANEKENSDDVSTLARRSSDVP